MFILAVTNSFFENWNLYQRFHDMQLTLSLQFFSKKNFCIPACVSSSLAQIVFIFCWKKVFFGHTWLKLFALCIILDIEVKQKTVYSTAKYSLSQLMEWPIAKCLCLVWRHTHVYCICISKIKKTLSCFVEICQAIETTDNDLLRKEGAKHFKRIHTNETYAGILYHVQCTCIMPTHVQVLSWHDLWVSFGLLTSGLYCTCRS